jgi:hypothetical protein
MAYTIAWLRVYARPPNANHNEVDDSLPLQQLITWNTYTPEQPAAWKQNLVLCPTHASMLMKWAAFQKLRLGAK